MHQRENICIRAPNLNRARSQSLQSLSSTNSLNLVYRSIAYRYPNGVVCAKKALDCGLSIAYRNSQNQEPITLCLSAKEGLNICRNYVSRWLPIPDSVLFGDLIKINLGQNWSLCGISLNKGLKQVKVLNSHSLELESIFEINPEKLLEEVTNRLKAKISGSNSPNSSIKWSQSTESSSSFSAIATMPVTPNPVCQSASYGIEAAKTSAYHDESSFKKSNEPPSKRGRISIETRASRAVSLFRRVTEAQKTPQTSIIEDSTLKRSRVSRISQESFHRPIQSPRSSFKNIDEKNAYFMMSESQRKLFRTSLANIDTADSSNTNSEYALQIGGQSPAKASVRNSMIRINSRGSILDFRGDNKENRDKRSDSISKNYGTPVTMAKKPTRRATGEDRPGNSFLKSIKSGACAIRN